MRLFIDSNTVFDVGDRVRTTIESQIVMVGRIIDFAVKIQPDGDSPAYAALASDVELVESASDLICGWTRENEIRQYAEVHHMSIAGALALLVNSGLSHL